MAESVIRLSVINDASPKLRVVDRDAKKLSNTVKNTNGKLNVSSEDMDQQFLLKELIEEAKTSGFIRLRVNDEITKIAEIENLDKRKKNTVEAVVDRLILKNGVEERLTESVETALLMGNGSLIASLNDDQDLLFSEALSCKSCDISFPTLTPQSFSFNSPQGMCQKCNGLGTEVTFDRDLVIPDGNLTPLTSDVSLICTLTHSTGISLGFFELLASFKEIMLSVFRLFIFLCYQII